LKALDTDEAAAVANELIDDEMFKLIAYDNYKYPDPTVKLSSSLPRAQPAVIDEIDDSDLADARSLVKEEMISVIGDDPTFFERFVRENEEEWDRVNKQLMYLPSRGSGQFGVPDSKSEVVYVT
jgi:hypothetical protein